MLTLFLPRGADYAQYITTYTPKFLDFPMALESVLNDARLESVVIFDIIPRSKGGLYLSSYVIQHASIPFSKTRVMDAGKKLTIVCLLVCLIWGLYLSYDVIQHASIPFSKTRIMDAAQNLTIFLKDSSKNIYLAYKIKSQLLCKDLWQRKWKNIFPHLSDYIFYSFKCTGKKSYLWSMLI